jgi:hypothetical protein
MARRKRTSLEIRHGRLSTEQWSESARPDLPRDEKHAAPAYVRTRHAAADGQIRSRDDGAMIFGEEMASFSSPRPPGAKRGKMATHPGR